MEFLDDGDAGPFPQYPADTPDQVVYADLWPRHLAESQTASDGAITLWDYERFFDGGASGEGGLSVTAGGAIANEFGDAAIEAITPIHEGFDL